MSSTWPRRLAATLAIGTCLLVSTPAAGAEWQDVEGTLKRIPDAVHQLRREARSVWADARPVTVDASIRRGEDGRSFKLVVETTFVTNRGVVDGRWIAVGDALPEVHLERREYQAPNAQRTAWERDFGVLRKFDWSHLAGDWLDGCALPRPDMLSPGDALFFKLEVARRTPVLVMRWSEGVAACPVDDRGTIYPFTDDEDLRDPP